MIKNAINFLVDNKKDDNAANGLLRLIYYNNISLSSFQIQVLIKFQQTYDQTILRFFMSLSLYKQLVGESLPPTPFCFTTPILKAIQDGGRIFYNQVPLEFMPYIIEISCYSFNESQESFDKFLTVFKEGSKQHFNHLLINNFGSLLQGILEQTKLMVPQFFKTLNYATTVLERAFLLLKGHQLDYFSSSVINDLIQGDHDTIA